MIPALHVSMMQVVEPSIAQLVEHQALILQACSSSATPVLPERHQRHQRLLPSGPQLRAPQPEWISGGQTWLSESPSIRTPPLDGWAFLLWRELLRVNAWAGLQS